MSLFIQIYIFTAGLVFGSFFNVVGIRLPLKQSIINPPSTCPDCQHQLTTLELIPVISFLIQKGKCRNCSTKISLMYPIFELITAILFLITFKYFGLSLELIFSLTLISLLIIVVISDINYMIIPDKVLLFFAFLFIFERIFIPFLPWWNAIFGAIIGFSLLLIIAMISKGGMGGGDIKLFAILGFVLGWKLVLLAFFMSTFFGAIFGGIGLLLKKVERGKPIPFAPFIALGTLVTFFWGESLINWYVINFLSL